MYLPIKVSAKQLLLLSTSVTQKSKGKLYKVIRDIESDNKDREHKATLDALDILAESILGLMDQAGR